MAENKKSFIVYCEWQESFNELSDEEAGILIKHIFAYVNDENPVCDNKIVKMCFIPIKQTLKRDLVKYESYIEKQRVNGLKGGRPKKTQKTQRLISKPKKADNVNDNVNVNDSSIKRFITPTPKEVLHYMTEKGYPNQADRFCDFYGSKGWMIGKNKMKDWKSAVRNWNRKDTPSSNQPKIQL